MAKKLTKPTVEPSAAPVGGVALGGVAALGRKRVGQVTAKERDVIKDLFERKNALMELAKSLNADSEIRSSLYEKLVADLGPVSTKFSAWWAQKGAKYRWERTPSGRWEIDFETCEIYLID
jgi:CXXX repeat modification system protein